jgi:DNA-binding MarR family transcriptional regulator
VSSGAITNRISRLEKRDWVRRDIDPEDRRQVLVSLTAAGLAQADHIIAMKTQAERWAFDGVDRQLLERIARDLRTLLLGLEERAGEVNDETAVSR